MTNPTDTTVYVSRTFGLRQINLRKIFLEVINVCCGHSRPQAFLRKDVLKICSKFAGEHYFVTWTQILIYKKFVFTYNRRQNLMLHQPIFSK